VDIVCTDNAQRIPSSRQEVGREGPYFPTYNPFHHTCFFLYTFYTPQCCNILHHYLPIFLHTSCPCPFPLCCNVLSLLNFPTPYHRSQTWLTDCGQPISPTSTMQHPRVPQIPYLDHTTTPSVPPYILCLPQQQPQLSLSLLCSLQHLQSSSPLSSYNPSPGSTMTCAKEQHVCTIAGVEPPRH